jgi:hypothetical protein
MRKISRRRDGSTQLSQLPPKRALRLSRESIRTLNATELPLVASGCPTGSWPTQGGSGTIHTDSTGAGTC